MKKSPAKDQPKGRVKDGLGTIREEEEDDDRKPQQEYTSITPQGERTLKTNAESEMTREKKKRRRGWEAGMKKIKSIVVHPLTNLEQKYVQLMTGFAGRVSPRGTPTLMRARAVPVWEL